MKTLLAGLAFVLLTGFNGCASAPQSPQQAIYGVKSSYEAALVVAVAYKRLPRCAPEAPKVCSDPVVVAQLQKSDNVASAALDAAEAAVRAPGFGEDIKSSAIATAQAALTAFVSITKTLNIGGTS